jgi:hypothetical protein
MPLIPDGAAGPAAQGANPKTADTPPASQREAGSGEPAQPAGAQAARADVSWKSSKMMALLALATLLALLAAVETVLLLRPHKPQTNSDVTQAGRASAAAGMESFETPEWLNWCRLVDDSFGARKGNEQDLATVVDKRPSLSGNTSARFRYDQAIANVLISHTNIASMLKRDFGIYPDTFLGTGLSKPVEPAGYGSASLHEYLVPNLPENDHAVWTSLESKDILLKDLSFRQLITTEIQADARKATLRDTIVALAEKPEKDIENPSAVIRFAIFPKEVYSKQLGRTNAFRVFACNLNEVWNLKIKDAADLSGYGTSGARGDTFFIGIFLPTDPDDAVLATWENIFKHLPKWLENPDNKIN